MQARELNVSIGLDLEFPNSLLEAVWKFLILALL